MEENVRECRRSPCRCHVPRCHCIMAWSFHPGEAVKVGMHFVRSERHAGAAHQRSPGPTHLRLPWTSETVKRKKNGNIRKRCVIWLILSYNISAQLNQPTFHKYGFNMLRPCVYVRLMWWCNRLQCSCFVSQPFVTTRFIHMSCSPQWILHHVDHKPNFV